MKSKFYGILAASLAAGIVGVLLHHTKSGWGVSAENGAASLTRHAESNDPRFGYEASPSLPTSALSRNANAEADVDVTTQDSVAKALDPSEMASNYAKAMQTGVFSEDQLPEFAVHSLFPTERSRLAAGASQAEYLSSPVDPWSIQMEQLLRTSFEQHPLVANVRVSIACRAVRCELHFIERTVPVQPKAELGPNSVMLMTSVAKEEWFRNNFVDRRTVASTPVDAEVAYQRIVLSRRHQEGF